MCVKSDHPSIYGDLKTITALNTLCSSEDIVAASTFGYIVYLTLQLLSSLELAAHTKLASNVVSEPKTPPFGRSIKQKPGNKPMRCR